MAAIESLAIVNLDGSAEEDTLAYTSDGAYFVSVIVTNTSSSTNGRFWVKIAPAGSEDTTTWGTIARGVPLAVNQSFETLRFALNNTDELYVQSDTDMSFIVQGINQPV